VTPDAPPRAGRREWIGLAVIALPCLLVTLDLTVLFLAVPALSADLQPSSSQLLWITDIYGFTIAGALILMGTLGDRIGRRRLLLIGAAAFGLASLLAAFSTSAEMLIGARALLGIAGATLAPSTLSLIRNMFPDPGQHTIAIGVWISSFSAGAALGPLLGGVLLEYFWWGSVFLLAVPVMVLLLAVGPLLLPEFRDPEAGRLDIASAVLSLAGLLAVIYGLTRSAEAGLGWLPALSVVVGLAICIAFVQRQRTLAYPLVDLQLFRERAFSTSLAANTLGLFVLGGTFFFSTQYLQLVLGLSPLRAGLWTAPSFVALIAGSLLTPAIVRRVRPAFVMAAGLALAAVGFGLLTLVSERSGLAFVVIGSIVFSLCLAPMFTLATDMVMGSAPPERAGTASGISEANSELGYALGIAILGSAGTALYRSQVSDSVPTGVPPGAAEAARNTLAGAIAASERLPHQSGADLLLAARQAFTHALQFTAAASAAVMAAGAVLVVVLLREARAGS
jgi:DHA2 family multidrug resistance protein-like MFS transporter